MKHVTILCFALILLAGILTQSGVLTGLMLFILMGIVPGTDYSIPAWVMLTAIAAITWLIMMRTLATGVFRILRVRHFLQLQLKTNKHLPRRRYSRASP